MNLYDMPGYDDAQERYAPWQKQRRAYDGLPDPPMTVAPMVNTSSNPSSLMELLPLVMGQGKGTSPGGPGATQGPNGQYDYKSWAFPFPGLDPDSKLLETRHGVTLQAGPLQSLIDIARRSDILPGAREVGQILQGYRSPEQQRNAAVNNPNAADFGHSYHPEGLAIDAAWWTAHPELARMLRRAGWNQLPSESWHWSYGVSG